MGLLYLGSGLWAEGGPGETFGDWSGVDGGGGDGSTGEISLGAGAESGIDPGGDEGQVYIGSDDPGSYNGITDLPLSDDPSPTTIDPGTADSLGLGTLPVVTSTIITDPLDMATLSQGASSWPDDLSINRPVVKPSETWWDSFTSELSGAASEFGDWTEEFLTGEQVDPATPPLNILPSLPYVDPSLLGFPKPEYFQGFKMIGGSSSAQTTDTASIGGGG